MMKDSCATQNLRGSEPFGTLPEGRNKKGRPTVDKAVRTSRPAANKTFANENDMDPLA